MAFCKYCGSQLEEGQICSCPEAQAEAGLAPQPAQNVAGAQQNDLNATYQNMNYGQQPQGQYRPAGTVTIPVDVNAAKDAAKGAWGSFVDLVKAPITGGAAFVSGKNKVASLVFIVIQAVLSAIFACTYVGTINKLIGTMGMFGASLDEYKFSGVTAFFVTLLFSIITAALFTVIFWGALQIAKTGTTFMEALDLAGVRAAFTSPLIVLAIIVKLLNAAAGFGFFYGSAVVVLVIVCAIVLEKYYEKRNLLAYILVLAMVVFMLIAVFIFSKSAMLYVPKSIKDSIGDLSNLAKWLY